MDAKQETHNPGGRETSYEKSSINSQKFIFLSHGYKSVTLLELRYRCFFKIYYDLGLELTRD